MANGIIIQGLKTDLEVIHDPATGRLRIEIDAPNLVYIMGFEKSKAEQLRDFLLEKYPK